MTTEYLSPLLERVVRAQRFGTELSTAIKRQSVRSRKPKEVVLKEYEQARALNERLLFVVGVLQKEYPYLEDKLESISNTLNIYTPQDSPKLTDEGKCRLLKSGQFAMTDQEIIEAARLELEVLNEFPKIQDPELNG